jgi:hypothetical protein
MMSLPFSPMRLAAALIGALAALAAAAPASSQAAAVSKSGSTITFSAGANEANRVFVAYSQGKFSFTDSGASLVAASGCTLDDDDDRVTCPTAGVTALSIDTGSLDDRVTNWTFTPATITGGEGNDNLTGGGGADTLWGGPGADTIWSRDFAADTINCGPDVDTVSSDSRDTVGTECETVNGTTTGGGEGGGDSGGETGGETGGTVEIDDPTLPQLVPPPGPVVVTPAGVVRLEVACPAARGETCDGDVILYVYLRRASRSVAAPARRRRVRVGRARFSIAAGELATVNAKLTRRGRKIVKSRKRTKLSVQVSRRGGGSSKPRKVTVKRAKKKKRR